MTRKFFVSALSVLVLGGGAAIADDKPPRRIYVPLEHLDVVLERDQRGVILPRAEFDKLWAAAKKVEDNASTPPAVAVVSAAKYTARVSRWPS